MNGEPVVSVRGLCVRWRRKRVLEALDLDVRRGSVTALVGCNGSGKSTLLRVLVGALVPDAGSVRVLGLDPRRDGPRLRARIGYVPERTDVARWMRGRDWLAFVRRFYATWNDSEAKRLVDVLEFDTNAKVAELSKGGREKLALVAALAHQPELVLLDEPFSGLDAGVRRAIAAAVIGHLRDDGRSVLLVSHSASDIERLADRVALLENGRITRDEELEHFARTPRGGIDLEAALARAELEVAQ